MPTLLKGRAWAVYEALTDAETDTYDHLKTAIIGQISPDTDEERLRARDELARRRLREGTEYVDELARDLEKLLLLLLLLLLSNLSKLGEDFSGLTVSREVYRAPLSLN